MRQHKLKNACLIGHSMGAKTVMTMALKDPDCCSSIVAVDNAPVDAALTSDFPRYVEGMRRVEDAKVKSSKEADQILEPYAKVPPPSQSQCENKMEWSKCADILYLGSPGPPIPPYQSDTRFPVRSTEIQDPGSDSSAFVG